MKKLISTILSMFCLIPLFSQPSIQWQKTYGGSLTESANSIEPTSDGGYIMVGTTNSVDGDVTFNHKSDDFWVVKLNETGVIEWQKSLGGTNSDYGNYGVQTADGGYIVIGTISSMDGDISGFHGGVFEIWVVKLTAVGEIEWQKPLGGTKSDQAGTIRQTSDGGYVVVGFTNSKDGDVSGVHGELYDAWVVKLSESGTIEWQKTYGGTNFELAFSIQQSNDGGYVFAGYTESKDGDVSTNLGYSDVWVVKLSGIGVLEWERTFGGSGYESASEIQLTSDGGYIIAGYTTSSDGYVAFNHGGGDAWVLKLNDSGDFQWATTLGGSKKETVFSTQQTSDGGYVVSGDTQSSNGDVTNLHGGDDSWIIKLNNEGEIEWQRALGGTQFDKGSYIRQLSDGDYIVAGQTSSNNGDITYNHGEDDCWVVKLSDPSVSVKAVPTPAQANLLSLAPNPANQTVHLSVASEESVLMVILTDIFGRQVSHQTIQFGGNIDISALPNGIYSVTATSPSGKVFSNKLTKQE